MDFPGQTLGNVWGYVQAGREYALLGGEQGLIIVDVTDPDAPVLIQQIPGPINLWKEVRTYSHYAYASTEGGPLQVIDLSSLPSPVPPAGVKIYDGDGPYAGQIQNIHTVHVDVAKGYLYLYGATSAGPGGAIVCDLNDDPFSPTYVGEYQFGGYIHDGFVDNDTLYAAHINSGQMAVVDITDKLNPVVLGTVITPNEFTHNVWPTDDRKTAFTTDERNGSYLTAYDVSDPSNISELDRFQCTPNSGSIPHNTHLLDDYAITAWYTDGVSVVDASNPSNLVQVAWYDTYPEGVGGGFSGCWGVYPYLPSGNMIATNIPIAFGGPGQVGKMFVLTPGYQRACWLEGKVTNGATGAALSGVAISLSSNAPQTATATGLTGDYKTGQPDAGTFTATFSKSGFESKNVDVTLENGVITVLNVELFPPSTGTNWLEEKDGISLKVNPSVFTNTTTIEYRLPANSGNAELRMTNLAGQLVWSKKLSPAATSLVFEDNIGAGTYFLSIHLEGKQTKALQVVKAD